MLQPNKFVQDKGITSIRKLFESKEMVRLLLKPGSGSSTMVAAKAVHEALNKFRKDKDPRKPNSISPLQDVFLAIVYQDEFEQVLVPLTEKGTIKHIHADRDAELA